MAAPYIYGRVWDNNNVACTLEDVPSVALSSGRNELKPKCEYQVPSVEATVINEGTGPDMKLDYMHAGKADTIHVGLSRGILVMLVSRRNMDSRSGVVVIRKGRVRCFVSTLDS